MAYDVKEAEAYIVEAARRRGIDPNKALKVARSEGLARGVWQSNVQHPTRGREPSYGPFQLLVGGQNGWPTGMGNQMIKETGISPADPANWKQSIDFGLDQAAKDGWRQWYGAGKVGVGRWDGIQGAKPVGVSLASNLGPGDSRAPIPVAPGDAAPPLVDRGSIGGTPLPAETPAAPANTDWDAVRTAFGEGIMPGMKALGDTKGVADAMKLFSGALGGGSDPVAKAHETPIVSNLAPAMAQEDATRMAMAQSMMKGILDTRRKRVPGMSLMG